MEKQTDKYANVGTISGENNDCVVRAFSIVLNKPYEEIHAVCERFGRKFGEGTYPVTQHSVATEYDLEQIEAFDYNTGNYRTVNQFLKAFPKGRYYVCRKGHAFAIIDGVIHDWARGTGIRSRIKRIFKVKD